MRQRGERCEADSTVAARQGLHGGGTPGECTVEREALNEAVRVQTRKFQLLQYAESDRLSCSPLCVRARACFASTDLRLSRLPPVGAC